MANAFIISNPYTFATVAVFNSARRAYDGILAMNLSGRCRAPIPGHACTVDVPDCEDALDLRAVINWTEATPDGSPWRGGHSRQPMTQDEVKTYFRNAPSGAGLTFEDPQTKEQFALTYYQVQ
jgi:hypothetical protein|tara:strand:- start:84 stop:452 length:369 start_codon:yes stop_codon:yes gene_type:complete